LANVGMLTALAAPHTARRVHLVLPIFALLLLPTQLGDTWLVPHNMWFFVVGFVLAALVTVTYRRAGILTGVLAALWSIGAILSVANGLAVVPAVLAALLLRERIHWREVAAYVLLAGGAAAVYLLIPPFELGGDVGRDVVQAPSAGALVRYVLIYLGAPLSARQESLALWAGGALLVLIAGYGLLAWRRDGRASLAAWAGVLTFAVGSGVLIAVGRASLGTVSALFERYSVISSLAWGVLIALLVRAFQAGGRWALTVPPLAALLSIGYIMTAYLLTPTTYESNLPLGYPLSDIRPYYECVGDAPFTRNFAPCEEMRQQQSDRLAAYRMAGFAHRPSENILRGYRVGDAVVVQMTTGWQAVHVRDWMLDGVPSEAVTFILPDDDDTDYGVHPPPSPVVASPALPSDGGARVWWVTWPADAPDSPQLPANFALGFDQQTRYGYRVQLGVAPLDQTPPPIDYPPLTLTTWRLVTPYTVAPCASVTWEAQWATSAPLTADYKLTFVLAASDGLGLARSDALPGVPTSRWEVGTAYATAQTFSVPCDLPDGSYDLLAGWYTESDAGTVPLTDELRYLTTLTVARP
jgi:hypothetical protein